MKFKDKGEKKEPHCDIISNLLEVQIVARLGGIPKWLLLASHLAQELRLATHT